MASSRRTYDTDVITLRTVFAKNALNSNIPALRTLTADGTGGTYWAIPSSLGQNPAFNEIITSAGTYTADLSYNRFRLLVGEGLGMVNGPAGSNQTTLYGKSFTTVDVSGGNSFYAFTSNSVTPTINIATTGFIQARADPATNTLFIDGPVSNPYIVSTGQYGFYQLKVTPQTSSITSSVIGWDGAYITANSPSTILRFAGYNDIELSTNVTTNTVFFGISTFTSKGYLDISANAYGAYPSTLSTVSSLYVQQTVFNSTVAYLSSYNGFGFSSVVSSINALAMSTGEEFYTLTGLINARVTLIQEEYDLVSTVTGLGSAGYLSTGGGAVVGIDQFNSTIEGLGSLGYISSLSTIETSSIFNTGAISTYSLEVFGSATLTASGSTILRGPIYLAGPTYIAGAVTTSQTSGLVGTTELVSSLTGLGSLGYVSTASLVSTVRAINLGSNSFTSTVTGLGSAGYISTASLVSTVSGINNGTILSPPALFSSIVGLGSAGYVSTASLTSTALAIQTAGALFPSSVSTTYGTSFTTLLITPSSIANVNIPPSASNLWVSVGLDSTQNVAYSSDGSNWLPAAGARIFTGGPAPTLYGTSVAWNGSIWVAGGYDFTQNMKYSYNGSNWFNVAGSIVFDGNPINGITWNGTMFLAVGTDSTQNIKYSYNGLQWSNASGSLVFSTEALGAAWNGSMWIAVGTDATQSIKYSYNGIQWSNVPGSAVFSGGTAYGVAWNGKMWLAYGSDSTQNLKYSYDGLTWSNIPGAQLFTGVTNTLAWNGKLWLIGGVDTTQNIKYSSDGLTWTSVSGAIVFTSQVKNIEWNGSLWVAAGFDTTQVLKYSSDGLTWSNATGSKVFASGAYGVGYSSNVRPAYKQPNFVIQSQTIPLFLTSTNQLSFFPSSLIFNNTLLVDTTGKVGINTGTPQTDLDVAGTGRFGILSSLSMNVSSINNNPVGNVITRDLVSTTAGTQGSLFSTVIGLGSANYVSTASLTSTVQGIALNSGSLTSTVTGLGSAGYISTLSLTSTVTGLGSANYVSTASLVSTVQGIALNSGSLTSTVTGLGSAGYISTPSLTSTVIGLGSANYVSTASLVSTVQGIALNSGSLTSTVTGLGSAGYISSLTNVVSLSSLVLNVSSINGLLPGTGSGNGSSLTVSTGSLYASSMSFVKVAPPSFNVFVAGGQNTISYSSDGSNWATASGFSNTTSSFALYDGTRFYSGGGGSGWLNYSSDGVNYSATPVGAGNTAVYGIVKGKYGASDVWIAGGVGTTNMLISYDGINFNTTPAFANKFTTSFRGGAYDGKGTWVFVGVGGAGIKYALASNVINLINATGGFTAGAGGRAVAYNGRMWVAVGLGASVSIKYSYDGITWTNATNSFTVNGQGIVWNGTVWVAVGQDTTPANNIKYSYDGINWSNSSGTAFNLFGTSVTWNGSLFVAGGDGSTTPSVLTSTDGITWAGSQIGYITSGTTGLAYSYSATPSYSQSNLAVMPQGIPIGWYGSNQVLATSNTLVFNNTLFTSFSTNKVGINTPFPQTDLDVVGTGRFQALSTVNIDLTTINGQTFGGPINSSIIGLGSAGYISTASLVSTVQGIGLTSGSLTSTVTGLGSSGYISTLSLGSTIIGLGSAGYISTASLVSTVAGIGSVGGGGGAISFVSAFTVSTGYLTVSTVNNLVVNTSNPNAIWVTCGVGTGVAGRIYYSYDGSNWSFTTSGTFTSYCWGLGYNGKIFVAGGTDSGGNTLKYSGNGINWSNVTSGAFTTIGTNVTWNGRYWVACGQDTGSVGRLKYSFDGLVWTNATSGVFSAQANSVAWNGYMWVGVGSDATSNGTIRYSYNGSVWSATSGSGFTGGGTGIAWNGKMWVATGTGATTNDHIKYSYDGITWSNSLSGAVNNGASCVIWNGKFWLVGGNDTGAKTIKYSYDGLNWLDVTSGAFTSGSGNPPACSFLGFNGRTYVAGGYAGGGNTATLKYSLDGLNWLPSLTLPWNEYAITNAVAYSSNVTQPYVQDLFSLTQQNIPSFLFSTNSIQPQVSSLLINNVLQVDGRLFRVGVNCNAPTYPLDVYAPAQMSSLTIFGTGTPAISTNTGFALAVFGNGAVGRVGGTTWTSISDQRVKDNIVEADYDRCYTDIKAVALRRFTYISSFFDSYDLKDRSVLGFVAQEVSCIQKKAVYTAPVGDIPDAMWLNIDQLNMSLYGAVKKTIQDKEILESTIKGQRFELETLRGTQSFILSTLEGLQGR